MTFIRFLKRFFPKTVEAIKQEGYSEFWKDLCHLKEKIYFKPVHIVVSGDGSSLGVSNCVFLGSESEGSSALKVTMGAKTNKAQKPTNKKKSSRKGKK